MEQVAVPRSLLCTLLLTVLLAFTCSAFAAEKGAVTATVLPVAPGVYRVSVLFPGVPGKERVAAAMNTLVQKSGWSPQNVTWSTTPKQENFPAQTATGFLVNTLFPNGEFPVEAFTLAFRSWGEINVMFAHGGTFQYRGEEHYENADVTLDATPGPTSLVLRIVVKNPNVQRLTLGPVLEQPGAKPLKPAPRQIPAALWVLVAILGGVLVWVMVYAISSKSPSRPVE